MMSWAKNRGQHNKLQHKGLKHKLTKQTRHEGKLKQQSITPPDQ